MNTPTIGYLERSEPQDDGTYLVTYRRDRPGDSLDGRTVFVHEAVPCDNCDDGTITGCACCGEGWRDCPSCYRGFVPKHGTIRLADQEYGIGTAPNGVGKSVVPLPRGRVLVVPINRKEGPDETPARPSVD
jgi:hypothetical protein